MPLVSIVMPCFNHGQFVRDSANAILSQSHADLELVIVDDCSSDNSWEIIQQLAAQDARVKAIRHEINGGASKSRNDGLKAACGEFIGFCDADDVWEPDKLKLQLEALMANQEHDIVYSDAIIIDENSQSTGELFSEANFSPAKKSGELFYTLIEGNFVNMQTVLMRRACLDQSGYFDESIKWVEDWYYWVKLSQAHSFLYQPQVLARYRVHSTSSHRLKRRGYAVNRFKVFRKLLVQKNLLSKRHQARIVYKMGLELCRLHKLKLGRRLLWNAVTLGISDLRAVDSLSKALARLIMFNGRSATKSV